MKDDPWIMLAAGIMAAGLIGAVSLLFAPWNSSLPFAFLSLQALSLLSAFVTVRLSRVFGQGPPGTEPSDGNDVLNHFQLALFTLGSFIGWRIFVHDENFTQLLIPDFIFLEFVGILFGPWLAMSAAIWLKRQASTLWERIKGEDEEWEEAYV